MNALVADILTYLHCGTISTSLRAPHEELGRPRLAIALVRLVDVLRRYKTDLPYHLRSDWEWCNDLKRISILTPEINSLVLIVDDILTFSATLSIGQQEAICSYLFRNSGTMPTPWSNSKTKVE